MTECANPIWHGFDPAYSESLIRVPGCTTPATYVASWTGGYVATVDAQGARIRFRDRVRVQREERVAVCKRHLPEHVNGYALTLLTKNGRVEVDGLTWRAA